LYRFRDIGRESRIFIPLYLAGPLNVIPKIRKMRLPGSKGLRQHFSPFDTIHECDRQTDR